MLLPIIYQDTSLVVINKPSGLLVHRSPIDKHETRFAVQMLRDQIGQAVFPVHRLDKPTSGVLVFALHTDIAKELSKSWQQAEKRYFAICRGLVNDQTIDHPITIKPDKGDTFKNTKIQTAQTHLSHVSHFSLPVTFGKNATHYTSTTFSWVCAQPQSGRRHQIRKHLKHIHHPIVGDTRYGRGEINRYFREHYQVNRLMLHCSTIRIKHPITAKPLTFYAPLPAIWKKLLIKTYP